METELTGLTGPQTGWKAISITTQGAQVKKPFKQLPKYHATSSSSVLAGGGGSKLGILPEGGLIQSCQRWLNGWTQDSVALAFSIVSVMLATATERIAFKMSVDRLTPYRFVLAEMILLVSLFTYGLITVLKRGMTNQITAQMSLFPHSKLMIMALLDTIQFSCLVCSGAGVTPTMTVILLNASTPAIVFGSRVMFPDRTYSEIQMRGVYFITGAIAICMAEQIYSLFTSGYGGGVSSSVVYVAAAALHGVSTLYKEKCIIEWMQPIDVHFLSSWLFFYQVVICAILGPAIYLLQGVSNNGWTGFPLGAFYADLQDGLTCFHGRDPLWAGGEAAVDDDFRRGQTQRAYDTKYTECSYSFWLVVLFVVANVVVLESIDRILQTGNQVLGRATAAAVLFAFLTLGIYDSQADVGQGILGTTIGWADIVSIIALLIGIEFYGRDSPQSDGVAMEQQFRQSTPA